MGRGTTIIEAALLRRNVIGNDVNPLSIILTSPRLDIPDINKVKQRLDTIKLSRSVSADIDLSMFFHKKTESELVSLQRYLSRRKKEKTEDSIDRWIRMVATNRLTGHSKGFFSVYTLPPNQAAQPENQRRINKLRNQKPEYRDIKTLILKKSRNLLNRLSESEIQNLNAVKRRARYLTCDAGTTPRIGNDSVQLTVTSPPFLNVVQYSSDNWLRLWFNDIDDKKIAKRITMSKTIEDWCGVMRGAFTELFRVTRSRGYVAFEVGEVQGGKLNLEDAVLPLGREAGFSCESILINMQQFTKTANIWGINNNVVGTNTNRIVLFRKS